VGSLIVWIVMFLMALVYLMPVYVMVANGLKDANSVSLSRMWNLPAQFTLDNGFVGAWERLSPNMVNSLIMVIPATFLSAFIGAINGYLFAKWKFPGSDIIFTLMLFGFFIPYQSILIPLVKFMQFLNLYGDLPGLILVHIIYGIPITTLIFRNYYASISTEIIEASRIDGASLMGIYRNIILPLSAPAFAVVIIWQFTQAWNEFLFAVILTNQSHWPVTVALNNLAGSQLVQWNVLMAATFLAALPTLLVYIFLGRFFLRGLMAGALKG
jgi:glucose/mannose transport system permease protein